MSGSLTDSIKQLRKLAADNPDLQLMMELLALGYRIESEQSFSKTEVLEIVDVLLRQRSPTEAIASLDRVAARSPLTLLHRAAVAEIQRRDT